MNLMYSLTLDIDHQKVVFIFLIVECYHFVEQSSQQLKIKEKLIKT